MSSVAPPLRSLLVVDDDASIREVLTAILASQGYPVVTAAEGEEALALLHEGLRPCLVLLDLRMPGMDGRAFREEQMKEAELALIPVVILTGDRDGAEIAAALGTEHITKPIELDQLLALVSRFGGACAA